MFKELLIKLGVGVFLLCIALVGVKTYIAVQVQEATQKKMSAFVLALQNQAIQKRALDTKSYIQSSHKTQQNIITKYKTITIKDKGCEEELKEVRNALDMYYASPSTP